MGRTTSYQYDLAGNRVGVTDPLSRTTTYGYDPANDLTGIHYSDGTTPNVAYTYTATGQRASMTDGTGTTSYQYDALDRPITVTNGAGQALGYGYDAVGNVTRLTYPDGSQVSRSYDTLDRLSGVTDWHGHTSAFGYDQDSNLITETLPNTTSVVQSYTSADQLTGILAQHNGDTLWSASYGRDLLGQVITSTDTLDPHTHSYSYSPLDQLIADQAVSGTAAITQTWSPNSAYELTARTDPSGAMAHAYGYDAASEVLTDTAGSATTTYSYDGNGNRISQQDGAVGSSASYGYDQADRLTSAAISATAGITAASYAYDGDGLRQSKTVTTTGGVTTTAEVWDASGALPLLVQDGTTKYLSGPDGLPLEQLDGGRVAYDLHDQLGSTRLLLDSSGNTQATYTYDAYGNLTASTSTGTGGGTTSTPFGFAGQYTDAETGLQYLQARYYDPQTGQFTSVDPLVDTTGQPYAYAADDPLNGADPTGQWTCFPSGDDPCDAIKQGVRSASDWAGQRLHDVGDALHTAGTYLGVLHTTSDYMQAYEANLMEGISAGGHFPQYCNAEQMYEDYVQTRDFELYTALGVLSDGALGRGEDTPVESAPSAEAPPPVTRSGQYVMFPEAVTTEQNMTEASGDASQLAQWVDENSSKSPRSDDYEASATGARSSVRTRLRQVPALTYTVNGEKRMVRFDGLDDHDNVLIDRKISIYTSKKMRNNMLRQSQALSQNGLTARWEVPNGREEHRVERMLKMLGVTNITVRIVPE